MRHGILTRAILAACFSVVCSAPQEAMAQALAYRTLPIDVDARPGTVRPVQLDDGRTVIAYDIFVGNWSEATLTLARIDVEDATDGRVLARVDAAALDDPRRVRTTLQTLTGQAPDRTLAPGRTAFVSLEVTLTVNTQPPAALRHRIVFENNADVTMQGPDGVATSALEVVSAPLPVDARPPVVIGPPLRGGPWRCSNGYALTNSHAAIYVSHSARVRMPQRYGCDFQKVDAEGQILPVPLPPEITNQIFFGYGAELLAVADGVVAGVRDGIPENVPRADGQVRMPVPLTDDTVAGNTVTLDIGGGVFVFYAHLQPGSPRVRAGDRVRRGQVIGLLGNSGNAVGPHLHFQVGDGPVLNASTARPYVFDRYRVVGHGRPGGETRDVRRRLPVQDSVLEFPAR